MAFIGVNTTDGDTIETPVGAWSNATTYTPNQIVTYNSNVWIANKVARTNQNVGSPNIGQVTIVPNLDKTPVVGSEFWSKYDGLYWSTKTLITKYLSTFTHDKFVGSVFHDDTGGTTAAKLYVQQSGDGVIWDVSAEYTTAAIASADQTVGSAITSGYGIEFSEEIILPYIRFKFVYGTNKPATLRLFGRCANAGVKY